MRPSDGSTHRPPIAPVDVADNKTMIRPLRTLLGTTMLGLTALGLSALAWGLIAGGMGDDPADHWRSHGNRILARETSVLVADIVTARQADAWRIGTGEDFAQAWQTRDRAALRAQLLPLLDGPTARSGSHALRRVRLLGTNFRPVAGVDAGVRLHSTPCDAQVDRAGDIRLSPGDTVVRPCWHSGAAMFGILIALPPRGAGAYLEFLTDASPGLARIAEYWDVALAPRAVTPGSTGAAMGEPPHETVLASHLLRPDSGDPGLLIEARSAGYPPTALSGHRAIPGLLGAALIVLAAALLTMAMRRWLRPLNQLREVAQRVPDGIDLSRRFGPIDEHGPAEISTTAHAFNHMLERLSGLLCEFDTEFNALRAIEAQAASARELAEAHSRQFSHQQELSQATLASVVDGVIATDRQGGIELMNPMAERLTGWKFDDARGRSIAEILEVQPVAPGTPDESRWSPARQEEERLFLRRASPDGRSHYLEIDSVAMTDHRDAVVGTVVVLHDVTETHLLTERLKHQATHDALTGLINRYEFERRLESATAIARNSGKGGVLCYLDLDEFKVVNDTCGHAAGDELLRQLGLLMTRRVGELGTLARLGGDEFGLLLAPAVISRACAVAEELREAIAGFRFIWGERVFSVSASIGLAETLHHCAGADVLLSAADTACHVAKDRGSNRVQVHTTDDDALRIRHAEMDWVSEINRALEQDRLRLHCQPIVPAHERNGAAASHFEILLRMAGDDGTLVPPGSFLPAAERYGLAPSIDRWVIRNVFAWMARKPIASDTQYAINLSGRSLVREGFLSFVEAAIDECRIRPANLCFEITETAAIDNFANARAFIRKLRERGCCFSLDDFGSGVSSFTYLSELPVDYVKIDGSFVRDIATDPVCYSIVRSINDVGHAMNMRTIAEFVETKAAARCLREIGVDFFQGFEYGQPQPLQT
jgi:diguanylate cyclase (GGDEF)-like protein/PAS domain S-box-containing protein